MKKSYLIPIIVIFSFLILGAPLFIYGIDKTLFYSQDPDVVYITNAILYTKYHLISYADHPGTPTIMFIYYLFIPLRVIAKYIFHQDFLQWSFDNYLFLTYYARIFELLLTSFAFCIYLYVIKKITNSKLILVFVALSIFVFGGLTCAISVVPENLSFFLTAVWLWVFVSFIKKRNYFSTLIMISIAGFCLANKFTSLFLLLASIPLVFYVAKLKFEQKYIGFLVNVLAGGLSFYLGILPAISRFTYIKNWALSLFSYAGGYGSGVKSVFDWITYSESITTLLKDSAPTYIFIIFTVVLGIYLLVKKKLKINNPIVFLAFVSLLGILVFSKYPVIRYNYTNILLIIFCATYFMTKFKTLVSRVALLIITIFFLMSLSGYISSASNTLSVERKDSAQTVLNAWTPFWSMDLFREQF